MNKQVTILLKDGSYEVRIQGYQQSSESSLFVNKVITSEDFRLDSPDNTRQLFQEGLEYQFSEIYDFFVVQMQPFWEPNATVVIGEEEAVDLSDYLEGEALIAVFLADEELVSDGDTIDFGAATPEFPFGVPISKTFKVKNTGKSTLMGIGISFDVGNGDNFSATQVLNSLRPGKEFEFVVTYDGQTTPVTDIVYVNSNNADNNSQFMINVRGLNND